MAHSDVIVVGVDGSKYSRSALHWALEEAQTHGRPVQVVSTWAVTAMPGEPLFMPLPAGAGVDLGREARELVESLVDEVAEDFPDVQIDRRVVAGNPAQELIDLSERASMVVVGARGHGGFVGMLLGSVSQHVLAHSRCTVVVVR